MKALNTIKSTSTSVRRTTGTWLSNRKKQAGRLFMHHPILSVVITLALLLGLIAVQSALRKPKAEAEVTKPARVVDIFSIGQAPRVKAQAQIKKSGVIKIVAQTSGVVQQIPVKEGQTVSQGQNLAYISTSYGGGSTLSVQRQIAQKQYANAKDTYDEQKDLIAKQREIAEKSDTNTDELRSISAKSIDESKSLLSVNNDILNNLNHDIAQLEATNSADINRSSIQALKQSKTVYQSTANSLSSSIRNLEYSTDSDGVQSELANLNKDVALKQLDIQEKALTLGRDVSYLQYQLASINESLAYPSSPCYGVVEKVHVKFGDVVSPGMTLFTVSTTNKSALAVALVSQDVAAQVSILEPSILAVGSQTVSVMPSYVSQEATDGVLYSIYYAIPEELVQRAIEGGYIEVEIPVGNAGTTSVVPYIPLDAVHQTQDGAYVYLAKNNRVVAEKVTLGTVYGQYVEVREGIHAADHVILDRNVVDGDRIKEHIL